MTYGDELREEGRQEAKQAIAKNMLCNLQLDVNAITQATGLSRQELAVLAR